MRNSILNAICAIVLALTACSARALTTTFTGAVDQDFQAAGNWDNGVPGAADTAIFNAGTCNLAGTVSVLNFTQNGGTFTGTGTLTVTGTYIWAAGTIDGGGAITIPSGGTLNINGVSDKNFGDRTINLAGNGTWTGTGRLVALNVSTGVLNIQSGALFDIQNDAVFVSGFGTATININSGGTLRKSAGTGTTGNTAFFINNSGMVDVQQGTLTVSSGDSISGTFNAAVGASLAFNGTHILEVGGSFTGAGTHRLIGGSLELRGAGANFTVANGTTFSLDGGTLTGAGTMTVNGTFGWTDGALDGIGATGTTTIAAGGVFSVSGAPVKDWGNRTLNLSGNGTWTGTGNINALSVSTGIFNIQSGGVFDMQNNATLVSGFGTATINVNSGGTLRKSVGTFTSATTGFFINNSGTIDIQSGTLHLQIATGFNAGCSVTGPGVLLIGTTLSVNGASTISAATTLSLPSQTISGAGTLTINGTFDWSGGAIDGGGGITIPVGGTLNINGVDPKYFGDRILSLDGNGTWTGTGNINALNVSSGVFNIQSGALFDVQNDANLASGFGSATINITSGGTLRKSAGTGTTGNNGFFINNSGTVDVQQGTLTLPSGDSISGTFNAGAGGSLAFNGTHILEVGGSFTGAGTHRLIGGSLELRGAAANFTVANGATFSLDGGTLTGAGTLTVNGTFGWTGGTLDGIGATGTTTIAAGGTLSISGVPVKQFENRTLNLAGSGTWTGTGNINAGNVSTGVFNIQSGGVFDMQNDATLASGFGSAMLNINSGGTLRKSAAAGTTANNGFPISNNGTLEVQSGTLVIGNYVQAAGTTVLSGGNLSGNPTLNGGTLTGAGTITGNVTNSATITPGGAGAAGTINITGTYTQNAGGALNIDLGGTAAGQFDVLAAGGAATLDGTLNVALFGGFNPATGNTFDAVTFASRTGVFSTANTAGTNVNPVYANTTVTLTFGAINPIVNITSSLNVSGVVSSPFTYTITASGSQPITFTASPLPPGLSFATDTISGTPTASATSAITLTATNALGSDTRTLIVNIAATGSPPAITSPLTASGVVGKAFSYSIAATGSQPVTFNATGLPAGLSLNGNVISGTPTAAGNTNVTLSASNTVGTDTKALSVVIDPAVAPTITSPLAVGGTLGTAFIYVMSASGTQPVTFSASPLPAGLTFSGNTISGTPAAIGTTTVALGATNVVGSDTKNLTIKIAAGSAPPVISATPNPALANTDITLSATVSDPTSILSWDFGDATPAGSGNPVTHRYAAAGEYTVSLTVDFGIQTGRFTLSVLSPNSGADGVVNVSDGKPPVTSDSGITSRVAASNGGVVEIDIDPTNFAARATFEQDFEISTSFVGISGRSGARIGSKAVNKFTEPGVFVADTEATKRAGGEKAKARKTVAISRQETGQAGFLAKPADTTVALNQIKGKFLFTKSTADAVSLSGTIKLPAGLDISKEQTFSVGIGNIIDSAKIGAKGKGVVPSSLGRIKKLSVKYPKLSGTTTAGGESALVSISLSLPDMDAVGFDTEGISANSRSGSGSRSVQVALVLAGVAYESALPVEFKLSTKGDAATIAGRSAR